MSARTIPSLAEDASPDAYAEGMVRCQGYAPSCSDAFQCLQDGFCFGNDGEGFKRARKTLDDAIKNAPDVFARSWLRLARDALEHHQFLARCSNALRVVAINEKVRKEYGLTAPRQV